MASEQSSLDGASPWLTVKQSGQYTQSSRRLIYNEIKAGRLRAARIGGRRELRLRREWLDQWLESSAAVVETQR